MKAGLESGLEGGLWAVKETGKTVLTEKKSGMRHSQCQLLPVNLWRVKEKACLEGNVTCLSRVKQMHDFRAREI